MNSTEQSISDKESEILKASENLNTVQEELYAKRKEMVNLRNSVSDLYEAERKCKFNLSKLKMELRKLTRDFWNNKQ